MVNTELFETMQRDPSLRDRLATQIEGMIVEQRLQPGDKLPSERELSRPSAIIAARRMAPGFDLRPRSTCEGVERRKAPPLSLRLAAVRA